MRLRYLLPAFFLCLSFAQTGVSADNFHGKVCADDKDSAECAEAKKWMRRNHPDVLTHERDRTMREGIRARADSKPLYGSLRACVSCHIEKDDKTGEYPAIESRDHHCSGCHQKVAVKLDCFECHSTKPDAITIKRLGLDKKDRHEGHEHE